MSTGRSHPGLTASVVVPTRNRPTDIVTCIRSIVAAVDADVEIVVVDQSDQDDTVLALSAFMESGRVRLISSTERGVGRARNLGARESTGDLIVYTDDDCTVPPGWVAALRAAFDEDPSIGVAFAPVDLVRDLEPGEFAAEFQPIETEYDRTVAQPSRPAGISANMALTRSAFSRLHGFDPMLGAGSRFPSAAETDLAVRAVAARIRVVNLFAPAVIHHGIRSEAASSKVALNYARGLGAAFAKEARLMLKPGRSLLPRWIAHFGWRTVRNLVGRRSPTGARFVVGLLRGACASITVPIDRSTGHFRDESAALLG